VELEALYDRHMVTTDLHKKQGALKYLATAALERMWRASDTFMDAAKTYEDFKKEIHKYYPGSSKDVLSRICRDPPRNARRKRSFGTSRRAHSNTHVIGNHVTTYG
jgi:hypothetical protein